MAAKKQATAVGGEVAEEVEAGHSGSASPVKKSQKKCPQCGATVFQGPFQRGPIVDGVFIVQEELVQCMGCNVVKGIHELIDH